MLTKMLCSPYNRTEPWKVAATLHNGSIYLSEIETEESKKREEKMTPREHEMCYWGLKFEDYLTNKGRHPYISLSLPPSLPTPLPFCMGIICSIFSYHTGKDKNDELHLMKNSSTGFQFGGGGGEGGKLIFPAKNFPIMYNLYPYRCPVSSVTFLNLTLQYMCIPQCHGTHFISTEAPPPGKPATPTTPSARMGTVNPNQAFCTVVRTRMASHSIVMAAEIDCVDPVSQFVPDADFAVACVCVCMCAFL